MRGDQVTQIHPFDRFKRQKDAKMNQRFGYSWNSSLVALSVRGLSSPSPLLSPDLCSSDEASFLTNVFSISMSSSCFAFAMVPCLVHAQSTLWYYQLPPPSSRPVEARSENKGKERPRSEIRRTSARREARMNQSRREK